MRHLTRLLSLADFEPGAQGVDRAEEYSVFLVLLILNSWCSFSMVLRWTSGRFLVLLILNPLLVFLGISSFLVLLILNAVPQAHRPRWFLVLLILNSSCS